MYEGHDSSETALKSHWFTCDSGPLVLLPSSQRNSWGRTHPVGALDTDSDYQRACKVKAPFGFIAVGAGQALVLAGNPKITFWDRSPNHNGIDLCTFVQWKSANLDDLKELAAAAQSSTALSDAQVRWTLPEGGADLMFAGDHPGQSVYGEVSIPIEPGVYHILKGSYENAQGTVFMLRIVQERH
jgi:hypothetical protein